MKKILSLVNFLPLIMLGYCLNIIDPKLQIQTPNNVHLFSSKSDTIIERVILDEHQNEFSNQNFIKDIKNEKLNFMLNLSKPKLFRFYSLKPQTAPSIIYVSPNDSITYKLDSNNTIVFEGKNAAQYNFFNKLNASNLNYKLYSDNIDIWEYKNECKKVYFDRCNFLKLYVKSEKVSNLFEKKAREVLFFEYLNRFLIPEKAILKEPKCLEDINIEKFKVTNYEDNTYFHLALMKYLNYTSIVANNNERFSIKTFNYQLNLINNNFLGNIKEYCITKTFFDYNKNLKSENIFFLKKALDTYLPQIKEEKFKIALKQLKEKLNYLNPYLPDKVLNSKLLDVNGNIVTLNEVLIKNDSKIKVIDFWASWCAPCIEEIRKSYPFRGKIDIENNISIIYFSIDKNSEKWKKKVSDLKGFGMDKNQYLILEAKGSDIASYFNINTIPQYLIFDKENRLVLINAPSPSEDNEFASIIKNIK